MYIGLSNEDDKKMNEMGVLRKYDESKLKKLRLTRLFFPNIKRNEIIESKFKGEKIKILKALIAIVVLIALFIVTYVFLAKMIAYTYVEYGWNIFKTWLAPILIELLIVKFIFNYLLNLWKAILLFYFYKDRKIKASVRFLYKWTITKDEVYMYKIRNFVTKWEREVHKIDVNKVSDEKKLSIKSELDAIKIL
jgi:hypothetical protein